MPLTDTGSAPAGAASSLAAANGSSTQSQPLFRDNDAAAESDSDSLSSLLDVDDPSLIAIQTASTRSTDPSSFNLHSRSVEKPLASTISTSQIEHSLKPSLEGQIAPSAHSGGALASTTHSPFAMLHHYTSEKAAMHVIAGAPRAVLLFSHPEFPLCKVMERHLGRIAGAAAASTGWLPSGRNVRVKQSDVVRGGILQETDTDGLKSKGSDSDKEKPAKDNKGADTNMGNTKDSMGDVEDEKEEHWSLPERSQQENTLFLALQAEDSPFLTARLRIRVLPAVIGYVSGEEVGRLTGLEGLGKLGKREAGWRRVSAVLRSWSVLGTEMLVGEDVDEDQDEEGDSSDEDEDGAGDTERMDRGNWIGGSRMTRNRGNGKIAREDDDDDDDDDDWD